MSFIRGLPEHLRPADVAATVDELLAAARRRGRRGVAAPPVRADAISRLVADVRARVAAGEISSCAIAVPADQLDAAIPLLESALAEGDDVDLDVLAAASAEEVAGPDDLVLSAS